MAGIIILYFFRSAILCITIIYRGPQAYLGYFYWGPQTRWGYMSLITTSGCSLWWGDQTTSIIPPYIAQQLHIEPQLNNIAGLQQQLNLSHLVFLNQNHGTDHLNITSTNTIPSIFTVDGDFITTNQPNVGIGIVTADCLPIIAYDTDHHALGIAHASWKTSAQQILLRMLEQMQQQYQTNTHEIKVWFGPSARPCCYEIQSDFLHHFQHFDDIDCVIHTENQKTYFNLPTFNRLLLERYGVKRELINTNHNLCTICNEQFCSARRNKNNPARQISLTWLH